MPDPETPFNDSLSSVLRRKQARERWHSCRTLIIDEVSMIDGTMLDRLEFVARALKQTTRAFGGIQLILCGDFLQLPPVTRSGPGVRCFQAACWGGLNLQPLVLSAVKRQDDDRFSALLNRIRRGIVDHRDISALTAPKAYDMTKRYVRLFSTNDEVQRLNAASFEQLRSPIAQYNAIDSGEPSQLETLRKSVPAAQRLSLRVGAQVILLKNISVAKGLANGTTGTVVSFVRLRDAEIQARDMLVASRLFAEGGEFAEPMLPVVDFSSRTPGAPPTRIAIVPDAFNLEEQERILASRVQIPLALAWAMTIHKSQGMTLPAVEADLGRCFEVGQAYVALSRAVCIDTLVVRGLTPRSIRTCPLAVAFYESLEAEVRRRALLQASQSQSQ
jgi:ATP-dependent DNA helicase PIF1